jgi:hypothetical protein
MSCPHRVALTTERDPLMVTSHSISNFLSTVYLLRLHPRLRKKRVESIAGIDAGEKCTVVCLFVGKSDLKNALQFTPLFFYAAKWVNGIDSRRDFVTWKAIEIKCVYKSRHRVRQCQYAHGATTTSVPVHTVHWHWNQSSFP